MTVAAAWREVEADLEDGDGVCPGKATVSSEVAIARVMAGDRDPEMERGGGREFISGAMAASDAAVEGKTRVREVAGSGEWVERMEPIDGIQRQRGRQLAIRVLRWNVDNCLE